MLTIKDDLTVICPSACHTGKPMTLSRGGRRMTTAIRYVFMLVFLSPALLTSAASQVAETPTARIAEVERSLDLAKLMHEHGIPGISVAVIDHFKLAWAKGYGVTEKNGSTPVTPRTLFLAGSISKPVAALGALALVDRGKLDLNRNVNDVLKTWRVPENKNTVGHKVTLALILDHTAGFTGGDFYPGYVVGQPFPTLPQILDGRAPATNDPVRVNFLPG